MVKSLNDVCPECGAKLELKKGNGREFSYRQGYTVILPYDFEIPTCVNCGMDFMDEELDEKAREICEPIFLKDQKELLSSLIESLRSKTGMSLAKIQVACGHPVPNLKHSLETGEVNKHLLIVLDLFVRHPEDAIEMSLRK